MANLDTVSGVTRIDESTLEITSNVNIGAGIDDLSNHVIIEKSGGILRFTTGCATKFRRCKIVMTDSAATLGGDNYNNSTARFNGTCAPEFYGCTFQQHDGMGRSDFDTQTTASPKFLKDEFGNKCYFHINNGADQYNHFASSTLTVNGAVMNHLGTGGAFEVVVPPAIDDLELVDNNPGADIRHFVVVALLWADNSTYSIRGLKCRRVMMYVGNATKTLVLIDPKGDIRTSTDDWQNNQCVIKITRTYQANPISAATGSAVSAVSVISFTDNNEIVLDSTSSALSVELLQDTKPFGTYTITTRNSYRRAFAAFGYIPSVKTFLVTEQLDGAAISDGAVLLFADSSVTAANQAAVDAYTDARSLERVYDLLHVLQYTRTDRHNVGERVAIGAGTQVDFGSYDLVISNSAPVGDPVELTSTTVTAYTDGNGFAVSGKFNKIVANEITLSSSAVFPSSCNLDADVVLGGTGTLSNVTITGNLEFSVAGTYILNSSAINTMTNTSGGAVIVQADPNTSISVIPDPGENITIESAPVTITITVLDQATKAPIENAAVYIEAGAGGPISQGTELLSVLTNSSGIATTSLSLLSNQPIQHSSVRKSSAAPFYTASPFDGTISSVSGFTLTVLMISEE